MNDKPQQGAISVLLIAFFIVFLFLAAGNLSDPWIPVFLSLSLLISMLVRNLVLYSRPNLQWAGILSCLADLMLIFLLSFFDRSPSYQFLTFIVMADIIIHFESPFNWILTAICIVMNTLLMTLHAPGQGDVFFRITSSAVPEILLLVILKRTRDEIVARLGGNRTVRELSIKSKQLEDAYDKLWHAARQAEELAVLRERNRIAREIHDAMGHALTTAFIEMEAGERLLEKSPELAVPMYANAKQQVKKGLADIRESVGLLSAGKSITGFADSLILLMDETASHGEIHIMHEISDLPILTEQQEKTIYRALQEGLTNGIRHGRSTAFVFKLFEQDGDVFFELQDNGTGFEKPIFGFGLTSMKYRVDEAGGTITLDSRPGEGCSLRIRIPLVGKQASVK